MTNQSVSFLEFLAGTTLMALVIIGIVMLATSSPLA